MKNKDELTKQAEKILELAKNRGVQGNFFFETTFKRYMAQIQILDTLEQPIFEHGPTVTKEYVKGRENLVVNPAITEYNKTSTAANGTVTTLINILKSLTDETAGNSKLQSFLDAMNDEK